MKDKKTVQALLNEWGINEDNWNKKVEKARRRTNDKGYISEKELLDDLAKKIEETEGLFWKKTELREIVPLLQKAMLLIGKTSQKLEEIRFNKKEVI